MRAGTLYIVYSFYFQKELKAAYNERHRYIQTNQEARAAKEVKDISDRAGKKYCS